MKYESFKNSFKNLALTCVFFLKFLVRYYKILKMEKHYDGAYHLFHLAPSADL